MFKDTYKVKKDLAGMKIRFIDIENSSVFDYLARFPNPCRCVVFKDTYKIKKDLAGLYPLSLETNLSDKISFLIYLVQIYYTLFVIFVSLS